MRIAQVAPLDEAVSPFSRGDVARCVAALADALVGLGHEVTLFDPPAAGHGRRSSRRRSKANTLPR